MLSLLGRHGSSPALKTDDDFQLTPMPDADADDSESGSQVIALDTEGEGDEGATMIARRRLDGRHARRRPWRRRGWRFRGDAVGAPRRHSGHGWAARQFCRRHADDAVVCRFARGPLQRLERGQPDPTVAVAVLAGIMIFDLAGHMRNVDPSKHFVNSSVLDWFLSWFEK